MKKAIYPGTFDPITFGHIDLIKKSLNIFDQVIVAVSDGNTKNYLFDANEREHLIKRALFSDLKISKKKIIVTSFKTLTTDFCKKMKSNVFYQMKQIHLTVISKYMRAQEVQKAKIGQKCSEECI